MTDMGEEFIYVSPPWGILTTNFVFVGVINREKDKTGALGKFQDAMAIELGEASKMLVGVIESSSRETHGGEFIDIDGSKIPW